MQGRDLESVRVVGDFAVADDDLDEAQEQFSERSARSRAVDNAFRGPIPANKETWEDNPRRYDYPGVDTPTEEPRHAAMDFPNLSGRRKLASRSLNPRDGEIGLRGIQSDASLSEVKGKHDASMDSLADLLSSPFED